MRVLILFLLFLSPSLAFAQREMTTIALNYASPEQIVTAIQPLLSPDSSVSSYRNQLVLNVTAEELANTRALLERLDAAGRQILISLRSDNAGTSSRSSVKVDSTIKTGDTVITTKRSGYASESRTTVRVTNRSGTSTGDGNQSVRATEGMPAYIATGVTAPVQNYSESPNGQRYYSQDYVQAVSGFYATTWVNDNVVRISIDQSDDSLEGRTVATQQLRSEVSGELGKWLPIGAFSNIASQQDQGIGSFGQSGGTSSTQLFIKVELAQ